MTEIEKLFFLGLPARRKQAATLSPAELLMRRPEPGMGIPDRSDYGDFDKLKAGGLYDYFLQRHDARKAKLHTDVRVGSPDLGLYSFATKKGLPEPGGKPIALFQQPVHAHRYGSFSGTLGHGYGQGTVQLLRQGKILVTDIDKNSIHFATADGQDVHRFVLVRPKKKGDKRWLAIHTAPPQGTGLEKKHYNLVPPGEVEQMLGEIQDKAVVQPKVDGAMVYARLRKDRLDILSHRTSKRTGQPIVHTERFFGGKNPRFNFPKQYQGAVLLAELHGLRNGQAIPAQELGGLLNSTLANSLERQKARKIDLKAMLYGIGSLPGPGNKNLTYPQMRSNLEDISKHLPSDKFSLPEEAKTPEAAKSMLRRIQSGEHPLTREGVIAHPLAGGLPSKVKPTTEHDVYVREIFPGEGRLAGHSAGGFYYSLSPGGDIAGKVGSGMSDETRRDVWRNRNQYVGRKAKLFAQEQYPSGAYRAPVFHSFHEDES